MYKVESLLKMGRFMKRSPVDPCYVFACWPQWKHKVRERVAMIPFKLSHLVGIFNLENVLFVASPYGVGLQTLIVFF